MKTKRKGTLLIIVGALLLVTVIGIAYAYFVAPITRTNQTTSVTTGTLRLTFNDVSESISKTMQFGESVTREFTIENTGTLDANVTIYWKDIVNTYLEGSLIYTLKYGDENTQVTNYDTAVLDANVPRSAVASEQVLFQNMTIPANTTYYYKLDITLVDSPTIDQTADLSATFFTKFTIKEYRNSSEKTLATLGLTNMVSRVLPDFTTISPSANGEGVTYNKCYCGGQAIEVSSVEACNELYEITAPPGYEKMYMSKEDFENVNLSLGIVGGEYLGTATWDGTTCTYEGNSLATMYRLSVAIMDNTEPELATSENECNDVYQVSKNNENIYVTGLRKVAGEWLTKTQDSGIYPMEDDYGTSYYYRGNITNNYVKFGKYPDNYAKYTYTSSGSNIYELYEYLTLELCESAHGTGNCATDTSLAGSDIYWRIVRINGDGSIRMIYDGTSAHANNENSTDRVALQGVQWNNTYNDAKYVGYMFGGANGEASTSKAQAQTNETNSNMKNVIENWYENIFKDTVYEKYISDEVFCNDRSTADTAGVWETVDKATGYGTGMNNYTLYAAYNRMVIRGGNPKLTCTNKNDAFTMRNRVKGNGMSKYPIGLITADELNISGSVSSMVMNQNTYVYRGSGSWYWSFSPSRGGGYEGASIFTEDSNGAALYQKVNYNTGVVPVINLSAEYASLLVGDGTTTSPYHFE